MSLTTSQSYSLDPAWGRSARSPIAPTHAHTNVGADERLASTILGGFAVVWGVSTRGLGGTIAAILGSGLVYRGVSGHCPAYDALGVDRAERSSLTGRERAARSFDILRSVTVQAPADRVFRAWRDPETFAQAMGHFASHSTLGDGRTRWTLHDPVGGEHHWETEVVAEEAGKSIRWRTVEHAPLVKNLTLELRPAPGDRGTEMTLHLRLEQPGGALGSLLVKLFGHAPTWVLDRALSNVKSLIEAGELPSLKNNPAARASAWVRS